MSSNKSNQLSLKLKCHGTPCNAQDTFSPMTDLAYNLGSMTTLSNSNDCSNTPRRRISWSSSYTPTTDRNKDKDSCDSSFEITTPEICRKLSDISNEPQSMFTRLRNSYSISKSFGPLIHYDGNVRNSPVKENYASEKRWDFGSPPDVIKEPLKPLTAPKCIDQLMEKPLATPNTSIYKCAEVKESKVDEPYKGRNCIRGLFRDPSDPDKRPKNKRTESSRTLTDTPQQESKRRKAFSLTSTRKPSLSVDINPMEKFSRCYSESEATNIMKAVQLSSENPDLIGDFTRPYVLPLIESKHQDLKSISVETLNRVLNGDFTSQIKKHIVIDCRFPYEYEGGHIKGAINIYSKEMLEQEFLQQLQTDSKFVVLIFHCEFSSERGPSMSRFLRNKDRETNEYPNLHYPEIYVLNGGYKAFFECCKELCEPQSYKPMLHADHEEELKIFRTKSKTWIKEEKKSKICHQHGLKM
uniref:M-phase inducer phosphatase n=1 Tax=Strigamia maritima TaxID=126957 RepID=T1JL22_STRMM